MSNPFFSTGSLFLTVGDNSYINLTITSNDNVTPVDITGYEILCSFKTNPSVSDISASLFRTVTTHSNAPQGQTSIPIYNTDFSGSYSGKYFYDVRMKDQSGNITTIENDTAYISNPITQNTNR
jgi:hypothetical protein